MNGSKPVTIFTCFCHDHQSPFLSWSRSKGSAMTIIRHLFGAFLLLFLEIKRWHEPKTLRDHKWLPWKHLIACWGVKLFLTKPFSQKLFFGLEFFKVILSCFEFWSFVEFWVFKFCHILFFFSFIKFVIFRICHILCFSLYLPPSTSSASSFSNIDCSFLNPTFLSSISPILTWFKGIVVVVGKL